MSISFHNSTFFSQKVIEKLFLCIWGWQSFRICFVSLRLLFKENVLIFQAFGGIRFWGNLPRHFLQGLAAVSLKARSWRDFWMRASRLFSNCKILPPQYSYKICISNIFMKYCRWFLKYFLRCRSYYDSFKVPSNREWPENMFC